MHDVTDYLNNFHSFLVKSAIHLEAVHIKHDEDDWDDFSEFNFKILVTWPLSDKYNITIDPVYGVWRPQDNQNNIHVKIPAGKTIEVGSAQFAPPGKRDGTIYYQKKVLNAEYEFFFVEFTKIKSEVGTSYAEHFKYVGGQRFEGDETHWIMARIDKDTRFYIPTS